LWIIDAYLLVEVIPCIFQLRYLFALILEIARKRKVLKPLLSTYIIGKDSNIQNESPMHDNMLRVSIVARGCWNGVLTQEQHIFSLTHLELKAWTLRFRALCKSIYLYKLNNESGHYPSPRFLFKTLRFGDWFLYLSSGGTYFVGPNR
jgi:hypothetical protein